VSFHVTENSNEMVPPTTFVTSTDETSNINVKAAFIHVIGDLLQSFGVLIAAYIIFYKVLLLLLLLLLLLIIIIIIILTPRRLLYTSLETCYRASVSS